MISFKIVLKVYVYSGVYDVTSDTSAQAMVSVTPA